MTTRHMAVEVELIRWMLLVVAAVALVLAIATALGAADPMREPKLLPDDMDVVAKPIMPNPAKPFFPEYPPGMQLPPAEAAARLWTVLENHRAGCSGEALGIWEQVGLPPETAHWREIAMGAAYLHVGDQERAAIHLDLARQLAPDHAVVGYFTGLLRLEQAAAVSRLPDGIRNKRRWLVAYTPAEDKRRYEMLAVAELRRAIVRASKIRLDEPLLTTDPEFEVTVMVPRVGDLLVALGADNFVGKAHNLLFGLSLDRGELADAEFHLDRATATGIAALYGYRDLAAAYLDQQRDTDAVRVAVKDLRANHPLLCQLCERLMTMSRDPARVTWVW